MHNDDDLAFGAGRPPGPGAARPHVAAGDAPAAATGRGVLLLLGRGRLACLDILAACRPRRLFRPSPPDGRLAGVVIAQVLADRAYRQPC